MCVLSPEESVDSDFFYFFFFMRIHKLNALCFVLMNQKNREQKLCVKKKKILSSTEFTNFIEKMKNKQQNIQREIKSVGKKYI